MSIPKGKGPLFDPGLCRCCGTLKKCRVLNVEYDYKGEKEVYSDMMMDCFGLLLAHLDGKPHDRLICATCVMRIRDAFSFRRQVLLCEEAFINNKMFSSENIDSQPDGNLADASKMEVEVKTEPCDADQLSIGDICADALPDVNDDDDKLDIDSDRDSPNDNMPLIHHTTRKFVKTKLKTIARLEYNVIEKKPQLPMKTVQQMIKERDPAYMTETNILNIVEFSYVCPFKCRHNHLLCYYCGENFSDPETMRNHTILKHHPKKFKINEHHGMVKIDLTRIDCRLCSDKIDNLEDFKRHIVEVHDMKYYFDYKDSVLPFRLLKDDIRCAICDATFPYFHALNKHMNVHFSNYVCETCGLGFVDKARLGMHKHRHEEGTFPCESCGKIFKAEYNRDLHVDRMHMKKCRIYCPKCDAKFMTYPQKMKHLIEVHGDQPIKFPCKICDRIYTTRRALTMHWRKDHMKDYRYECQCCGHKFFTQFALNNHMPTHTGERNFKCKVCEKSYPRLKTLRDHMRIHSNDRRYKCEICGQAFIQNCSLKGHVKSQHPEYTRNTPLLT